MEVVKVGDLVEVYVVEVLVVALDHQHPNLLMRYPYGHRCLARTDCPCTSSRR